MNAEQIIELIRSAEKKTPVKVYLWEKEPTSFPGAKEFPAGPHAKIVFGDWKVVAPALEAQKEAILDMVVENQARNSAVPLLDTKNINARIEPGAIIRDQVELGDGAVIMMGAFKHRGRCGTGHHDRHGRGPGWPGHRGQKLPRGGRRGSGRGH